MRKIKILTTTIITLFFIIGFGYALILAYANDRQVDPTNQTLGSMIEIESHKLTTQKSNQWYSSLYKSIPAEPFYMHPLVLKLERAGVELSHPTPSFTPKTVFAGHQKDLIVSFDAELSDVKLSQVGDWSITTDVYTDSNRQASIFMGKGFPFIKIGNIKSRKITVQAKNNFKRVDQNIFETNGKYYGIYGIFDMVYEEGKDIVLNKPQSVTVALIDSLSNSKHYLELADQEIYNTNLSFSLGESEVSNIYSLDNKNNVPALIALFPHQYENLTESISQIGSFNTIRGEMKLFKLAAFKSSFKLLEPPSEFTTSTKDFDQIRGQIITDINSVVNTEPPKSTNYGMGIWLGMVSNLSLLADAYGLAAERDSLLNFATPYFEDALTYHKYDAEKSSIVSTKPEYGNEELNDHHFHYGYFIRFGSIVRKFKFQLNPSSIEMLGKMVKDIANYDRDSNEYPYLRNFDMYESHSWADGYADSLDGNNQESTSEAINAWYSIYLWGIEENNQELQNIGLALYNNEVQAIFYYWFDKNNIYKEPYEHQMASIVWGGKVDFATWFSAKANMIYGIQFLPFSPASQYWELFTRFSEYEEDFLKSGGSENDEWGDLYLMWKSYFYPIKLDEIPKNLKFYDRNPKSLFLHVISKNSE